MKKLQDDQLDRVLVYLKKSFFDCLYMYIDIAKYGIDNENISVWYNEDEGGNIRTVLMKYYNSISIYSDRELSDAAEVVSIIRRYKVATINAKRSIIEAVQSELREYYNVEYGYVFHFDSAKEFNYEGEIETAQLYDMREIAELICADEDFGAMYNADNLANQLADRMATNFGRNYVIKKNGRIIAHIASYCEFDHVATTSGLVVAKEYRNGIYGVLLESYLVKRLWEDDFDVYTFVTKKLRKKMLERMGNTMVGEYGKMTIKLESEKGF